MTAIIANSYAVQEKARKRWIAPRCVRVTVANLTQAGGPGTTDSTILS